MLLLTYTEENYIKAIYTIQHANVSGEVSVNEIAERVQTRPATVTDMLKKLSEKGYIHYEKYKKVQLSKSGIKTALSILRKHRLWETFLHKKLHFSWDEVHEVAEQLEHIHSQKLIERLDEFLGFPEFDPHGDPIPKQNGDMPSSSSVLLNEKKQGEHCKIVAVKDTTTAFLQQLERYGIKIGSKITITELMPFDHSIVIKNDKGDSFQLSEKIAANLLVL
ncbi:MAG: metal-dependent transcriptional regulator [Bacteroidetes bacterium]|nr:metal-dependent transcriptional regulator [Bacteroidota bacterium]